MAFRPDGNSLRLTDAETGQSLLGFEDWKARAQEVEALLAEEIAARTAAEERATQAEARLRELTEELRRRGEPTGT